LDQGSEAKQRIASTRLWQGTQRAAGLCDRPEEVADRSSRIAGATNQSFEFTVYMRSLPYAQGETSGYRMNLFFGIPIGQQFMIDWGFGWGNADALWLVDGVEYRSEWWYFGVPIRVNIPLSVGLLWVQWDWNWLGHGDPYYEYKDGDKDETRVFRESTPFPLRAGFNVGILDAIQAEIQVLTPSVTSMEFATRATLGVKF